jgi:uncharacterized protein YeaC (DUF1315 family)
MSKEKNIPAISGAVSKEQAAIEVDKWLDAKKISASQREEHADFVKALAEYISEGNLQLNDDNTFTHTLKWPIGLSEDITELIYKFRLNPKQLKPYLSGVKAGDGNAMIYAHICALTSQNSGIITELDQEDIKIARSIAVFFV